MIAMSTITIRDIPEATHARLKVLAATRGGRRSVEGFARSLLVDAAMTRTTGFGDQLVAIGRQLHAQLASEGQSVTGEDIEMLFKRSDDQGQPASFE